MRKDFQNSPVVFWSLAAVAIGSLLFAVYTFAITKPSREISFRVYSEKLNVPTEITNLFSIKSYNGEFNPEGGYIQELDIWNSGNLEIETQYVLQPIIIKFGDGAKILSVTEKNLGRSNFSYHIKDNYMELSFDKILAKAGVEIRYYSPAKIAIPELQGLIADPIRGAAPLKNAALIPYDISTKPKAWYDVIAVLAPLFSLVPIFGIRSEIKPVKKLNKIIFDAITYSFMLGIIVFSLNLLYNITVASPPF